MFMSKTLRSAKPRKGATLGAIVAIAAITLFVAALVSGGSQVARATPGECAYADALVSFSPGTGANGDPNNALGIDNGTWVALGDGGSITVRLVAQVISNGPGADFRVYEVIMPPIEGANVRVSADGVTYFNLGSTNAGGYVSEFDLASVGLASASYVKITDLGQDLSADTNTQGYDLDAVAALNCAPPTPTPTPSPTPTPTATPTPPIEGRMTGGGSNWMVGDVRVTKGFEIHCDLRDPNNIEVNWPGGNNFHMTDLTSAVCTDDPAIIQAPPPSAPFDTFVGVGTGKLNNVAGATIKFTFVDAGEPGTSDHATIDVYNASNVLVLHVASLLKNGNFQTHLD